MKIKIHSLLVVLLLLAQSAIGQQEHEYTLTISKKSVNITGKTVMGMTVNGTIPGPTLTFTEGETAVIHVKNTMDVETSVHWHGLLLPNFQDGVPYLTTPPIPAGGSFTYTFPLKQSGTYWYHSHTMLQEQSGVFGSIVIQPKEKRLDYDKDFVLMLSDWTNEKPGSVLRNLKRGNEWYGIKKGTATPLNRVIGKKAFGAQLNFWKQRMEGADIADIYYPAFLANGKDSIAYPDFKPGEKVRLRIINGAASSSFWMTFGGESPTLIAADGLDVVPVKENKKFIAIAETYDFIITIPESGAIEVRAMAQDGSGVAKAYFGEGQVLSAEVLPRPDKIAMMKEMAKMDMKMGAPALKANPKRDERYKMKEKYGKHMSAMSSMDHSAHMKQASEKMPDMKSDSMKTDSVHDHMNMGQTSDTENKMSMENHMQMEGMGMYADYNYDDLKAIDKTTYPSDAPVKEILLNLTGNMTRYIWSMNGVPLSETDDIPIKSGEVTRITFNNLTMMHHPMHLHGHFFRVLNKNGAYSPLKHTVNVPPMQEVTIEFYGDTEGDWLFHCHVLYHMMSGMTRVFSYDTPRDDRMKPYKVSSLLKEMDKYYSWGTLEVTSHMAEFNFVSSNIRNQFNVSAEYGYNSNIEVEVSYERYINDYIRWFVGVNSENEYSDSLDEIETSAVAGFRYLTPYLFNLDVRLDHRLRPEIRLNREIMIFPRTFLNAEIEYQADFGWVTDIHAANTYVGETTWRVGMEYLLSRNMALIANYDNRFGVGGGLSINL